MRRTAARGLYGRRRFAPLRPSLSNLLRQRPFGTGEGQRAIEQETRRPFIIAHSDGQHMITATQGTADIDAIGITEAVVGLSA
jgi:hypothetical protein